MNELLIDAPPVPASRQSGGVEKSLGLSWPQAAAGAVAVGWAAGGSYFTQQNAVLLLGCLCLGCLFAVLTPRGEIRSFLYLLLSFVFAVAVVWYAAHRFDALLYVSTIAAFAVPTVIARAYAAYAAISGADKSVWYYTTEQPEKPPFVYIQNRPVRVRVIANGDTSLKFTGSVPLRVPLATAMYYLMKSGAAQYGKPLYMATENGKPFGWVFYTETSLGSRIHLDPSRSVDENNVAPRSVLIAQRIEPAPGD